jgi:hypothetical protein
MYVIVGKMSERSRPQSAYVAASINSGHQARGHGVHATTLGSPSSPSLRSKYVSPLPP